MGVARALAGCVGRRFGLHSARRTCSTPPPHRPMKRRVVLLALPLCAMPTGAQGAYPARTVRVIAPQAPGGGVDLIEIFGLPLI